MTRNDQGSGVTQNTYNVPPQQWNELGPQGQQYFNRLYEQTRSRRQEYLNLFTSNSPGNSSSPGSSSMGTPEATGKAIDQLILNVSIQSAQLFNQQQLEHQD